MHRPKEKSQNHQKMWKCLHFALLARVHKQTRHRLRSPLANTWYFILILRSIFYWTLYCIWHSSSHCTGTYGRSMNFIWYCILVWYLVCHFGMAFSIAFWHCICCCTWYTGRYLVLYFVHTGIYKALYTFWMVFTLYCISFWVLYWVGIVLCTSVGCCTSRVSSSFVLRETRRSLIRLCSAVFWACRGHKSHLPIITFSAPAHARLDCHCAQEDVYPFPPIPSFHPHASVIGGS